MGAMQTVDRRDSPRPDGPGADAGATGRHAAPARPLVRMHYMPGLDGVRALAVTAVLFYHAETLHWMPGGFLGVDVFFVLSGYLITSLLFAEYRNQTHIGFAQFYLRRARRLLPALFLLLGVVSLFAVVFLPDEITKLRGDVVAALTYSTNWWQIFRDQSYFEAIGRPPLLQHLWSLAVEEQFYFVWPLLFAGMLKIWHGRRRPILFAILGAIAVSTVLMIVLSVANGFPLEHDPSRVYLGSDTRISTMLVGAALALVWSPWRLSEKVPRQGVMVLDAIGFAALAALLWIFANVSEFSTNLYHGGFTVVAIVTAVLIAVTVHPAAHLSRWLFGLRPLRWIGERSYGIYLWHWPIYQVTRPHLDLWLTGTPNLLLRLGLTVGIAELSYRFVEEPVRHGAIGRWITRLRESRGQERFQLAGNAAFVGGVVALGVVLATVGLATGRPAPIPPGLDVTAAAARNPVATTTPPATTPPATSAPGAGQTPATTVPPPAGPVRPRVTAIGDSVMLGARAALQQAIGDIYVDADTSRQFGTGIDIVRGRKVAGLLSDTVVIHMGTNGVITGGQMETLMDILKDTPRVVFVNLKVPRSWEARDNDVLSSYVSQYPNAVLIDWHNLGGSHPEYFYQDGIHLRPDGARAYADLIAQQTAANP
jgi:peptidoglycan/LPS O-acetylase OafA/YrhL